MYFVVPVDHLVKIKEREKIDKYLNQTTEKAVEHEGDGETSCNWCTWNGPQGFEKEMGGSGNQRKNRNSSEHTIDAVSLNTQGSSGDQRRLAVT